MIIYYIRQSIDWQDMGTLCETPNIEQARNSLQGYAEYLKGQGYQVLTKTKDECTLRNGQSIASIKVCSRTQGVH